MKKTFKIIDSIGDYKYEGKKIKDFFEYDQSNLWGCLRSLFCLYYDNINENRKRRKILGLKKIFEYNLFKYKDEIPNKEILFFNSSFGRYNKNDFSPFYKDILKNMDEHSSIEISYINFPSFLDMSTYQSFDFKKRFPFQMFIIKNNDEEIYKNKKKYLNLIKDPQFNHFLSKKTKNINLLLDSLEYIFCEGFCEAIRYYEGHKKMLNSVKPKILIISCSTSVQTHSAIIAAKKLNIKTIEISHGIPGGEFKFPKDYTFPDKLLTYGKKDYIMYLKGGVPKKTLEITGDVRVNEAPKKKKSIKNQYNKVLWLTTGISNEHATKLSKIVFEFIKKNNLNLTIKMHPDDFFYSIYKKESLLSNTNCKITKKELLKHIKENDFIICTNTTAIVDVVANYKPIIFENVLKNKKNIFNYFNKTTFYDYHSLEKAFKYLKSKDSEEYYKNIRKQILEDFSYDYGNGAKNVSKVILKLIKSK